MTFDAVLPLAAKDIERSAVLRRSIELFLQDLSTCWVVVPDADLPTVASAFDTAGFSVVPETQLIPELGRVPRPAGWFIQQLVKMAIAETIETDFYLTLDADVVCVRPVNAADLIVGGRAVANATRRDLHPEWYAWAARILGVPRRSSLTHAVTPAVLSRHGMLRLQQYLQTRSGAGSWRSHLLENLPWTEYALYNAFLEADGSFQRYHLLTARPLLYDNCIWFKDDIEHWTPEPSFGDGGPLFSVLQSNTGLSADQVWQMIGPYLD